MGKFIIRKYIRDKFACYMAWVAVILYGVYIAFGVYGKVALAWIGESKGFRDMCELVTQFSSIVLGVYGVFIPVVMGRDDEYMKYFWTHIKRDDFVKDIRKIFISGICVILFSIVLMLYDVLGNNIVIFLVGAFVWCLVFYILSTCRFLNLFVRLALGNRSNMSESDETVGIVDPMPAEQVKKLDSKISKF